MMTLVWRCTRLSLSSTVLCPTGDDTCMEVYQAIIVLHCPMSYRWWHLYWGVPGCHCPTLSCVLQMMTLVWRCTMLSLSSTVLCPTGDDTCMEVYQAVIVLHCPMSYRWWHLFWGVPGCHCPTLSCVLQMMTLVWRCTRLSLSSTVSCLRRTSCSTAVSRLLWYSWAHCRWSTRLCSKVTLQLLCLVSGPALFTTEKVVRLYFSYILLCGTSDPLIVPVRVTVSVISPQTVAHNKPDEEIIEGFTVQSKHSEM